MSALEARGRAIGVARRRRVLARVREAVAGLPGVSASVEDDRVVLSGRGLGRRALVDPALRWIAGWMR